MAVGLLSLSALPSLHGSFADGFQMPVAAIPAKAENSILLPMSVGVVGNIVSISSSSGLRNVLVTFSSLCNSLTPFTTLSSARGSFPNYRDSLQWLRYKFSGTSKSFPAHETRPSPALDV
jgi:hypothetical protein